MYFWISAEVVEFVLFAAFYQAMFIINKNKNSEKLFPNRKTPA